MLPRPQLAAALHRIVLISARGPWSRTIGYRHLLGPPPGQTGPSQPLWGGAAKTVGARFTTIGSFDSIYLAHDPITAFIEVVFPDHVAVAAGSYLEVYDPHGHLAQRISYQ